MPNLLTRLFRRSPDEITRFSLSDYLRAIADGRFGMTGLGSPAVSYAQGRPAEKVENSFSGYVYGGYKANPIVFGVMTKRASVFSEARFMWRRFEDGRPGDLFSDSALKVLNRPWPNGTTGELLVRMIQDVDLAGNCYLVNEGDRLRRLRPDWVQIVLSGDPRTDLDVDVIGYSYTPGSPDAGDGRVYLPDEVMHWSPIPDPDALYRGMSWLTPVVREIQGDSAAVDHKLAFFANGATLGPIVKVPAGLTVTQFKDFITASNEAHQGVQNAYRPMYVGGGADVTLGQATMQQMDFKSLQGGFETRVCVAGQVPAVIVGVSEGLAGSSLNAGNYNAAKRSFVDGTLRPLWRSACAALATIVDVPADAELWWDERDISYLREDMQDLADIAQKQMATINTGITAGFEPDAVVQFVNPAWVGMKHTGMTSVQLQPPGTTANGAAATDGAPVVDPAATAGVDYAAALESFRSDLAETFDEIERKFNPDQVRDPHSGEWTDVPGSGLLSFEYIQELYGQQIDEVEWQADSFVGVHERDGIILYFDTKPGSQDDHARFDVILDGLDGDAARALADQVEGIVSAAEQDDGGTPVSPNGLVDWSIVGRMLVGYDQAGDISLRVVGDDEDRAPSSTREQMHGLDGLDTSQEDATALVEALRELAPLADETEAARAHFMRRYATTLEVFRAEIRDEDSLRRAADYYDVRNPKGSVGGGRFRSLADRVTAALNGFLNGDGANDPLEPFSRDQLRKASKDLGMPPRRGASAEEIKLGLLTDARKRFRAEKDNPTPKPNAKFTLKGGAPDPVKVREVEVDNKIRAAYRAVLAREGRHDGGSEWIGLADLRNELGGTNRREVDAALKRLAVSQDAGSANVVPESNQKTLTPADRAAAVHFGDQDKHAISFEDASPQPVPGASKLRNKDVGVYQEADGKVSLYEESGSGARGARVVIVDDLAGLERWANDNGETELAHWARSEGGTPAVPGKKASPAKRAPRNAVPKTATEPSALSDFDQAKADMDAAQADVERFTNVDPSKLTPDERSKFYDDLFAAQDRSRTAGEHFRQLEQQRKAAEPPLPAFVPKNPKIDRDIREAVASLTGRTDLPSGGMFVGNPDWGIPMTDMHEMNRTNGNVYLADVRDALGEKYSRKEVDAALMDMVRDPSIRLTPIAASTSLSQRDRDSALHMGGTSYDLIKFETPETLPAWDLPAKAAPKAATPKRLRDVVTGDVVIWEAPGEVPTLGRVTREPGKGVKVDWSGGRREHITTARLPKETHVRVATPAEIADHGPIQPTIDAPATPTAKPPTASTPDATLATLRDMPTETRRDALDLRKMDELKAMLRESGLPVSGRKRDLVDRLVGHLDGGSTAPAKTASAKDRRVATMATRLHEDWRKTRLQGDGSFEPRVKATKDEAWIAAHGTDQVDIANTDYADLPEDWKAENRAAAEVIDNILQRDGGKVDLSDKQVRDQVGEEIHQEWLKRNDWAKGGELDVPFVDLPKSEQDKDIDQLRVAMGGGHAPGAVKKAAPAKAAMPAAPGQGLQPGYQLHVLPALHAPGRYNVKAVYPDGSEAHVIQNLSPTQARRELERLKAAGPDVVDAEYARNSRATRERNQVLMEAAALKERRTLRRRQLQGGGPVRLREQLAAQGLDTSGTTAQLINRLLDAEGLDAPSKAAVPKADGGQGSSILTQEDLQEGLTDSVQHDLASVQIHVRAASRVAERWDVTPAGLEALAREDGTWDFYRDLPADEQKKRFLQSQFAQWDSGSGKPVSVMAIQAAAKEAGISVGLNEREQRIHDWVQANPDAGHAAESMGRAMYAATQEWFRERGITSVKAQRATFTPGTEDANLYTSWSAMDAGNYLQQTSQHSVVEADIPVAQIFSVPGTGYGSPAEAEFVVIGGVPSTTIYMPDVAN